MGDKINLEGSFLKAEELCLNVPVTTSYSRRTTQEK